MAKIELPVLARQCPDRRVETKEESRREMAAWQEERNGRGVVARWQIATSDARVGPHRPYPATQKKPTTGR